MDDELLNFKNTHLARVALVMEEHVTSNLIDIGVFGAVGVAPQGDATRCLVRRASL